MLHLLKYVCYGKKTNIFGSIYTKRKKCHIAFQFTKSYVLQANEKELFKTYPKLTKKYPDSQLEYTGGSAKITQTLN